MAHRPRDGSKIARNADVGIDEWWTDYALYWHQTHGDDSSDEQLGIALARAVKRPTPWSRVTIGRFFRKDGERITSNVSESHPLRILRSLGVRATREPPPMQNLPSQSQDGSEDDLAEWDRVGRDLRRDPRAFRRVLIAAQAARDILVHRADPDAVLRQTMPMLESTDGYVT
jgi:hypothetical protein